MKRVLFLYGYKVYDSLFLKRAPPVHLQKTKGNNEAGATILAAKSLPNMDIHIFLKKYGQLRWRERKKGRCAIDINFICK
jgi:hypothetical protein